MILYMMSELGPCSSRLEKGFTRKEISHLLTRERDRKGIYRPPF